MPNDIDVQDHGSIFNHDAVVRFARSGGTSAPIAPLTVSRDAASSRLLGRILAAVSRLDEFPSPEPGLREISSLLNDIPGISGAVFEIDAVIDFSVDRFGDAEDAEDSATDDSTVDDRAIGDLRLIAGSGGAGADERNPDPASRRPDALRMAAAAPCGRRSAAPSRRRTGSDRPPRGPAPGKAPTIALLERANNDMAEAHLTLECDLHCIIVENAVLAAIAQSQGRALRGMAPDLALAPLLDTLKDLTRARHVGISHANPALTRLVFDPPR